MPCNVEWSRLGFAFITYPSINTFAKVDNTTFHFNYCQDQKSSYCCVNEGTDNLAHTLPSVRRRSRQNFIGSRKPMISDVDFVMTFKFEF